MTPRFLLAAVLLAATPWLAQAQGVISSIQSGPWSEAKTWAGGQVPGAGAKVLIVPGHTVTYDVASKAVIRVIQIGGTLSFTRDRDTELNVGLLRIEAGDKLSEDGFDCDGHIAELPAGAARPALEIGTPEHPIPADKKALIRLHYIAGTDKLSWPAIVCCGGRMDMHGGPMPRTWVRLGATAKKGETKITLEQPVPGWKVGDRILVNATQGTQDTGGTRRPEVSDQDVFTEEVNIAALDGTSVTLNRPLVHDHLGTGEFVGEVANLSRNIVIESADPKGLRGHTMYHRGSTGSLSYTEFRHLGKENVLGRYALHFHLIGDTMRGSYVLGCSIWDSHNRWLTIHGTNYLVVRDNIGYQSVGHGYYLEDGTEVYNVLDRNLAIQAYVGKRLPKQVLPFDHNDGAGFWWANSLNSFTRNIALENDRYGYRFEATQSSGFKVTLPIQIPDGTRKPIDIRTLPFVRFEDNDCHNDGKYGFNLGEGVNFVGPDTRHPFIVKNMKIWGVHYGFRPQSPSLLVENLTLHHADYGVYHPNYDNHVYKNMRIAHSNTEPFNRGHDDLSVQLGGLTVDGLAFDSIYSGSQMPLIQISDTNPNGKAESHFKNVKVTNWKGPKGKALVNLGGGTRPEPKTERGVPVILHDHFGPGEHALIVSTKSGEFKLNQATFKAEPELTGDSSRFTRVKGVPFPKLLNPVDDFAPITVITHVLPGTGGKLLVKGTTSDNGEVRKVIVNGQEARSTDTNYIQWQIELEPGSNRVTAHAEDAAGNVERRPHVVNVK